MLNNKIIFTTLVSSGFTLLFGAVSCFAETTLSLAEKGVKIEATGLGSSVLEYPRLKKQAGEYKILEKTIDGKNATLKYEGGGQIAVDVSSPSQIVLRFSDVPDDVKSYQSGMALDVAAVQGGSWQFDSKSGTFPAEKSEKPHLFQGNAKTFAIASAGKASLRVTPPPYSYQQLTDFRGWGQQIFSWTAISPFNKDWKQAVIQVDDGTTASTPAASTSTPSSPAPVKPATPAPSASGVAKTTLGVSERGILIESTGLGAATMEFPKMLRQSGEYPIVERTVDGKSATLKYEGGGQIVIDVSDPTQIAYKYSGFPADVKSLQTRMRLTLAQGPNRKWQFDDQSGEFPAEKPDKPHLFGANTKKFTLTNYENRTISFEVPPNTYNQITDLREWNQNIVLWTLTTPFNRDHSGAAIKIATGVQGELQKVTLVDKFGQSTQSDWPNKVKSEDELKADVAAEQEYYASRKPPALTKYGGLPGSREKLGLKATGFFHVEQKNGKWLLVDPEGNAFFHLGICVFGPGDDYTTTQGREQIYEWIPPAKGEFESAFRPTTPGVFSYQLANQIRKYNEPYSLDKFTARMIERVKRFGFNSVGAFSSASVSASTQAANFPYVASLPLGRWDAKILPIPGMRDIWDPFDEENRQKVEASLSKSLPARANDPLLIGYFLANEPLYEEIPKVIPGLKSTPAKRRLVQMLSEKYKTIEAFNMAWNAEAKSFDELNDAGLALRTRAASDDVQEYTGLFLDEYFRLVTETVRKYDPNHMLLGNRLQSATINNEQLCRIMGKYLDVISYNYYTYAFDKDFLTRVHRWTGNKPMMLTEFYWSAPRESGMSSRQDVSSQQERGLAYRNYVEQAAATGFIVGIEWFTLVDQATTGRWFSGFNGEAANTGLFSVADRPWKPALEEMSKTNYDIYKVWLGERAPFVFNDPRFTQATGGKKTMTVSRALGPMKIDGTSDNWPGIPAEIIASLCTVQGNKIEGFEAAVKMSWDETNLYILANVKDSTPMVNPEANNRLWNGDGLELFIGSEKIGDGGPLLFTDRQVLIGAGKSGQIFFANAPQQYPAETVVVPGVDGKSYTIEAAIPWSALAIEPRDNMELLFDLAIDDRSGTARERQLMWNGTAKNSSDRSHWGKAKLVR